MKNMQSIICLLIILKQTYDDRCIKTDKLYLKEVAITHEPHHEKTGFSHLRKRRSAVQ